MFFIAYLFGELKGRFRQTLAISGGLAIGIATVITISALAAGVATSEGKVLGALYGVGTDITVTTPAKTGSSGPGIHGGFITPGQHAQHFDSLQSLTSGPVDASRVSAIRELKGVAAASGGLVLTESKSTIPGTADFPPPSFQPPDLTSVLGVDPQYLGLGQYSAGKIVSGRGFTTADSTQNDAVLSSAYAADHGLVVGSQITVSNTPFSVIGIEGESQDANPPDVFIPLERAQTLAQLVGYVDVFYVKADNAGDVDAVTKEIVQLMPTARVDSSTSLAGQISGSLATVASLADTLGKWLAILALVMAFLGAGLMTSAAISRRAREFGTLKALGWPDRRIIAQVVGESLVVGLIGAALGVGLGLAAPQVVTRFAPQLSALVQESNSSLPASAPGANGGFFTGTVGGAMTTFANPNATHPVSIPFEPDVSRLIVLEAILLAIAGGVIAGGFGGWRIARLRPASALARLE